jgi:hypothetical protein
MLLHVRGCEGEVRVADAQMLLRGVKANCPFSVRVMVMTLPRSQLKPWYLLSTDLELPVEEAVEAYMGRPKIETNVDEVKVLGLGNSMGRSGQGVRRWPLFLCVAQLELKFMTTEEAPNPDSAPEKDAAWELSKIRIALQVAL